MNNYYDRGSGRGTVPEFPNPWESPDSASAKILGAIPRWSFYALFGVIGGLILYTFFEKPIESDIAFGAAITVVAAGAHKGLRMLRRA